MGIGIAIGVIAACVVGVVLKVVYDIGFSKGRRKKNHGQSDSESR